MLADPLPVALDGGHLTGVENAPKVTDQAFAQQYRPHMLDAAGGRAGAAAHEHDDNEYNLGKGGPEHIVVGHISRGGHQRHHLEHRVGDGVQIQHPTRPDHQIHHDQARGHHRGHRVAPQLLTAPHCLQIPPQGGEEQGKVDTGEEHKDDDNPVDDQAVVCADAGVLDREAAGGDGGKGVDHRVVQGHSGKAQAEHLRRGQADVDGVEDLGRVPQAGGQLALDGPGRFRPHQIDAALPQLGEQGQGQHQHANAAHPLGLSPPEEDPAGLSLDESQHRSAGCGEAGGRLEHRLGVIGNHPAEHIGQRPEQGEKDPGQAHGGKAVSGLHLRTIPLQQGQKEARAQRDGRREEKGHVVPILIQQGDGQRRKHQRRLHLEHQPQDMKYQTMVHLSRSLNAGCRPDPEGKCFLP